MVTANWRTVRWLVIDTETTGLDAVQCGICDLAAVWMESGEAVDVRRMLLDPGHPIPEQAAAVQGITDDMVAGKPHVSDVAEAFLSHVHAAEVLVGYNVAFDLRFLDEHCPGFAQARKGLPVIDPIQIVRHEAVGRYWRGRGRHRLTSVMDRLGLPMEEPAHRASADAVMTGRLLWLFAERCTWLPESLKDMDRWCRKSASTQQKEFETWRKRQTAQEQKSCQ